jgi:hypothetical protein
MSIQDMYKIDNSNPDRERVYKDILSQRMGRLGYDELLKVDDFIIRLLNGHDNIDERKNARYKEEIDRLNGMLSNGGGSNNMNDVYDKLKDALKDQKGGGGDNSHLLQQLID